MTKAIANAAVPTLVEGAAVDALSVDLSGRLRTDATLVAGDIEIGAVEIKNATTDTRAIVLAASTAAAATDTPLVVALHPSSPLGAGTAAIGKLAANSGVDIGDVTLTAGAAIVGQVGIDQTTPGTTNAVAVISGQAGIAGGTGVDGATVPRFTLATNVALPAGTNAIGKLAANSGVDIGDVDILSIAAGANVIGKVGIDQTTPGTTNLVAAGQNGTWNITNVSGTVSLPTGAATETSVAAAATSLAILDDWDETDRAKVNIIAGQVAITAGAGAVAANTPRVTLASDDPGVAAIQTFANATEYETVAASQTAQALGATGGTGDLITGILVVPATTSPGNVLLLDNATSITVFTGGASSVSNLVPFLIPLGIKSVSGAWKITTGASVSCIGMGNFT